MGIPVSKHVKHTPKHRQPRAAGVPKKALRNTLVLSSVAVAATGVTVGGGLASSPQDDNVALGGTTAVAADTSGSGTSVNFDNILDETLEVDSRSEEVSRSDRRTSADTSQAQVLRSDNATGNAVTHTEDLSDEDPREIAKALLPEYGYGPEQFGCLDSLYNSESGWRVDADNPTSSAYGIPQALPGEKMASAGSDWATNPVTQIRWGLGYIEDRYGSPCAAWSFKQGNNWY